MGQSAVIEGVKSHRSYADLDLPDWLQRYLKGFPDPSPIPEPLELKPSGVSPRAYGSEDIELICKAFEFAYQLHEGQTRKSGEPYIAHPVAVATLLRDLGADAVTVAAGFLHDVVEDTETSSEKIEALFGSEVRHLVDGVTKLSKFNFESKTAQQAENFRRMFVSMAKDIRVIVVKLADRLHNMRTLQFLPPPKQQQIASETMEIFAPLANRLGIWHFKWELEDLSFKYLNSEAYYNIRDLLNTNRTEREDEIRSFIDTLKQHLLSSDLKQFEISGRPKHLYGIYNKMQRQKKEFSEIFDLSAIRVIAETNSDCYRALATVHGCFRPIPGRFKDYIGLPKPNRYQSLHTAVIGPKGHPIEVQIRTHEMHQIAEYGIAAHWKYKESGASTIVTPEDEKLTWLRQLLEWQNDLADDKEYLDTIRENLFESEVYIFSPKGEIFALPQGSCPVDFAFRIHSQVGEHCAGAKVNNKMVPLDTRLRNGDIVQIVTQKQAHPSLDWISFVATSSARNRIRQWYKRSHREQNILHGRQALERELGKSGLDSLLKSDRMHRVAERCNYASVEELLAGLGYGEITVTQVVNRLQESNKPDPVLPVLLPYRPSPTADSDRKSQSTILGIEGLKYKLSKCCNPLPGDPILGAVTLFNREISIHTHTCPNLAKVPGERLLPVSWNQELLKSRAQTYPVEMQLEVIDRVGIFKDVLMRLSDRSINVRNAQVKTFANKTAVIDLCIDLRDKAQLEHVTNQLRQLSDVLSLRSPHQSRSLQPD